MENAESLPVAGTPYECGVSGDAQAEKAANLAKSIRLVRDQIAAS